MEFLGCGTAPLARFSQPSASINSDSQISQRHPLARPYSQSRRQLGTQEYRLRHNRHPSLSRSSQAPTYYILNPARARGSCRSDLFFAGRFGVCLRFQTKNMQQPIFQFGSEPQNTTNPLPSSSHCSSVQERLVTYGSEALDTTEHLGLILGSQKAADTLLKHFGSLAVLARASVEELLPFVPRSRALRLVSSLRMGAVALREERQSLTIDSPEAIADLCSEMRFLDREWLRVVLLNAKQQLIKVATVSRGSVNESLAHPREVFKPAIVLSAYSFILVHNHPSGDPSPSEADLRLARRISEASRVLQLNLIDHVIIGSPAPGRSSYFSFKEGGVIS
jgi:DNA repair protein RadC